METLYIVIKDCLVVVSSTRMNTNSSPEVVEKLTEKIQNRELKIIIYFNKTEYVSSAEL